MTVRLQMKPITDDNYNNMGHFSPMTENTYLGHSVTSNQNGGLILWNNISKAKKCV